jgi:hypothetical protein
MSQLGENKINKQTGNRMLSYNYFLLIYKTEKSMIL